MKTWRVTWEPIGEPDRIKREEITAPDWWSARELFCSHTHDYHGRPITLKPEDTRIYAIETELLKLPIRAPKTTRRKKGSAHAPEDK